eukprot:CAMPEP_0202962822 /NCGR_PEP_ID=MMETSP1396-20130829/6876_1 /ASSEMBLY_ACC=CAM_ASM_000872 /TAXON_ID= /ORGANISM="Pseudokeronopsis sp., Strain Brazil" /LENGTH=98 /DNA_ID=CAMNT_0049683617 /DNA_START=435 /DNA_END=731 /DNA_ORIENTATION=-
MQHYQGNFVRRHINEFVKAIDSFLKMDRKLVDRLDAVSEFYPQLGEEEVVTFESFYGHLSKWAVHQDSLNYDDFAKNEDEMAREEELEAFKKMTDRIL